MRDHEERWLTKQKGGGQKGGDEGLRGGLRRRQSEVENEAGERPNEN